MSKVQNSVQVNSIQVNDYEVFNVPVSEYLAFLDSKGFILPDFQRTEVWNAQDELALLETITNGQPMPTITLGIATEKGEDIAHFIIDGQQRTKSFRHLLACYSAMPKIVTAIQTYTVTVQLVKGSSDDLQALYTRVNAKSGLTKCQKVEGKFKGDVSRIKQAIKTSKEIGVLFTKTTKKAVAEFGRTADDKARYLEANVSGKVSDIAVYLTMAEINPSNATTNANEVEKALCGKGITVHGMTEHMARIPSRLDGLYAVMTDEVLAKAFKSNMAYPVAVYVLLSKYSVAEIIDGLRTMFSEDGKSRKAIEANVSIYEKDGKLSTGKPVTSESLFGEGSTNNREATQLKIALIEYQIKSVKARTTKFAKIELTEDDKAVLTENL